MKMLFSLVVLYGVFAVTACTKQQTQVVLEPIKAAGCAVESAITSGFGAEVVSECGGTNAVACGQAFQVALGNVNLCAAPLSVPAGLTVKTVTATIKTVGDVTNQDLKKSKEAGPEAVKTMGIVGAVACPIAINAGLGLLTGIVPAACGCTKNLSASQLGIALTAACVAAIPL